MKISTLIGAGVLGGAGRPWLAGGIAPSSVVAVYHSRGASSYAASKINLANAATHTLTDGTTAPSWTAAGGWDASLSGYLISDIAPTETMCLLAIYSGITVAGSNTAWGVNETSGSTTARFSCAPFRATGQVGARWGDWGTNTSGQTNFAANVVGLMKQYFWFNSAQVQYTAAPTWGAISRPLYLLSVNNGGSSATPMAQGLWSAFYIYDPAPTAAQLLAVDKRLRALFP